MCVQHHLNNSGAEAVDFLLARVRDDLPEVIKDMFGNYFVQTMFRVCGPEQRVVVLEAMEHDLVEIACDRNGTYALQSIVDQVSVGAVSLPLRASRGVCVGRSL